MGASPTVPGASTPKSAPRWRIGVALALAVAVILAGVWFYLSNRGGPPSAGNTPPYGLGIAVSPATGNTTTTFTFTATASDDQDSNGLIQVRWDWENDTVWDTSFSATKVATHVFPNPGTYVVRLEAKDTGNLTANATRSITVTPVPPPPNEPPHILAIGVDPATGNETTTFTFTAQVSDDHDPAPAIQVRWDWQDDGVWDTSFSTNKMATHRYAQPATYSLRLEAKDTGGLTSNATRSVTVTAATPPPLRIGTVLSLTGALGNFGTGQQNAVDMAVAEINSAGGVFGEPIQVVHMDDRTDPTVARQDAIALVTQYNVTAIIGSTFSGACVAILQVAESASVPEISPSCTSPLFSNESVTGDWFARTAPSDALQAVVAAAYAHFNRSFTYSGVIGINAVYGSETAEAYASNFTRMGGTITSGSPRIVDEFAMDYTLDIEAVLDGTPAPEIVYLIAYPPTGETLMKDWWQGIPTHPAWAQVKWLFSDGLYDPNFIGYLVSAGMNVTSFEGTTPALYAGIVPARYDAWAARYTSIYGAAPTLFAANAYDATYLVALAAEAVKNGTGMAIRDRMKGVAGPPGTIIGPDEWGVALQELGAGNDLDYDGASGSVNLNAYGDVPASYAIWAVSGSNQIVTKEFFNESTVVSLLPVGFFPQTLDLGTPAMAMATSRREQE